MSLDAEHAAWTTDRTDRKGGGREGELNWQLRSTSLGLRLDSQFRLDGIMGSEELRSDNGLKHGVRGCWPTHCKVIRAIWDLGSWVD